MKAWLLATVLFLASVGAHVDPHQRDTPLSTVNGLDINDLAISPDAVVVGTDDPDGGWTEPPAASDEDVWYRWVDSQLDAADDADTAGCTSDPGNNCKHHVLHVELSDDGQYMIIASVHDEANAGVLVYVDTVNSITHRIELAEAITSVDMAASGQRIAVGTLVDGGVGADSGNVRMYEWGAPPVLKWTRATAAPVEAVSTNEFGTWTMAGAGGIYRFDGTGTSTSGSGTYNPTQVKVNAGGGSTVMANADGKVSLVLDGLLSSPSSRDLNPANKRPITAVAIHPDGNFYAAGDDAGVIGLFADPAKVSVSNARIQVITGTQPVHDLAWVGTGDLLVAGVGAEVRMYSPDANGLNLGWAVELPAAISAVATSANGDVIAAAAGGEVYLFDASYELLIDAGSTSAQVGSDGWVEITYTNDGNRDLNLNFATTSNPTWQPMVSPAAISLAPGASSTVSVDFTVPGDAGSGTRTFAVSHSGTLSGSTDATVDVPQSHKWQFAANGSLHQAIEPGITLGYTVQIHNLGNDVDTTEIEANVTAGWSVSIAPAMVTLGPLEMEEISILLTAPDQAAQLDTGVVRLTALSDPSATIELTGTVGATFGASVSVVNPAPMKAGENVTVTATVRNAGNAPDAFILTTGALPAGWTVVFTEGAEMLIPNLNANEASTVQFRVFVPESATGAKYDIPVVATSTGDAEQSATATLRVVVEAAETEYTGGKDSPGVGGLAVVGLLAAAALLRRR